AIYACCELSVPGRFCEICLCRHDATNGSGRAKDQSLNRDQRLQKMGKEDMSISQNVTSALSAIIPTFAGGTMDRADQVRVNPERLKEAMMRPNARLLKLDGLNPVFDAMGDLAWGGLYDASPDNDLLLLGIDDGDRPCFAELTGAGS